MITELTLQEKIEVAAEQIENSLEIGLTDEKKQIRMVLTQFAKVIANGDNKSDEECTLPVVVQQRELLSGFRYWYDHLSIEEDNMYEGRYEEVYLATL